MMVYKNIFITGASTGIGEALSDYYAAPGITLGLVAITNRKQLDEVAERCRGKGASVHTYLADVSDASAIKESALDFLGRVNFYIASLVNEKGNDKNYMLKYGWRYGWRFYKKAPGKWFVDPTHLREYESKEKFVEVIQKAGFDVLEAKLTPLRLSLLEFVVRRIVVPLFKPKNINSFFLKHRFLDSLRRNIKIQPPGYSLVEAVAKKKPHTDNLNNREIIQK